MGFNSGFKGLIEMV